MMKNILLVHNIMWSHYKACVFSELYNLCKNEEINFKVLQIASVEKRRKSFGIIDFEVHQYPYELLFKKDFESIGQIHLAYKLIKEIKKFKPSIVVMPGYHLLAYWICIFYLRSHDIPILNVCDSTIEDKKRNNKLKEWFKGLILKSSDLIFCYGSAQKKYLLKLGVPENKVFIRVQATNNNIIRQAYLEEKNTPSIIKGLPDKFFLYVGRFDKEKNLIRLLQSFNGLNKTYSNWGLILIGDGVLKKDLEDYKTAKKLDKVIFIESKPWKELAIYYAKASAFILPSISEPWGLVANEAMVCELPLLISNKCGCAFELVKEGINGYTFDPFIIDSIKVAMEKIVNEKNINLMGEISYSIIQDYTPKRAAEMMYNGIKNTRGATS